MENYTTEEQYGIVNDYPGKDYQELFDHLHNEHGLTLLESEMSEIVHIVKNLDKGEEVLQVENNGWIKVENNIIHEDLIDREFYFTAETKVTSKIRCLEYSKKSNGFIFMNVKQWVSHYQPIQKPLPPSF